jgi:hypothetical protein
MPCGTTSCPEDGGNSFETFLRTYETTFHFYPEDGDSMSLRTFYNHQISRRYVPQNACRVFLRNLGTYPPECISYPKMETLYAFETFIFAHQN